MAHNLPPGKYYIRDIQIEVTEEGIDLILTPSASYTTTDRKPATPIRFRIPAPPPEEWEQAKMQCISYLYLKEDQAEVDYFLELLEDPSIYKPAALGLVRAMAELGTLPKDYSTGRPPEESALWPLFVAGNLEEDTGRPLIFDELLVLYQLVLGIAQEKGLA
jgi:hypothetical protein